MSYLKLVNNWIIYFTMPFKIDWLVLESAVDNNDGKCRDPGKNEAALPQENNKYG